MRYYIPMENTDNKKRVLRDIFKLCPKRHVLLIVSAVIILLHLATRGNKPFMSRLSENIVQPIHHRLALFSAFVPFSLAECVWAVGIIAALVYITIQIARFIIRKAELRIVYITLETILSISAFIYAMFCMLWGVYYYGDDFETRSSIPSGEISTEELAEVTEYFALLANEYAEDVTRNEKGFYICDKTAVLSRSDLVFENVEKEYPWLTGPKVRAKGMIFSRIMSYMDFTGFFFPFTAEANVNTDFPPAIFAATVAHELSHQRGVAKEQEANFVAVLASLAYDDPDYCYSACLMAYTYLGNALYSADYEQWERIYGLLDERIKLDFALDSYYWKQFYTPVQTVTNTVYEGFLQSYDQKLGMRSYGACVDLLVNYYHDRALGYLKEHQIFKNNS